MTKLPLFAVLLCVATQCSAAEPEWRRIESKDDGYSIEFPDKPKKTEHGFNLEVLNGSGVFICDCRHREPIDLSDKAAVQNIFDIAQQAMLKSLKDGEVLRKTEAKFGKQKYPMREFEIDATELLKSPATYKAVLVFTGDRFYQLVALGPNDFVKGDDVERFLESFELLD